MKKNPKIITFLSIVLLLTNCSSENDSVNEIAVVPNSSEMMFSKLNIKWDHSYTYKELKLYGSATTPYTETGVTGQIYFIKPNIIKEIYNGNTYQTTFTTKDYTNTSFGITTPDWHNKPTFPYINNLSSLYAQNGDLVWSYCFSTGGVYNCTQLKFTP